jgi:hypothetical protein
MANIAVQSITSSTGTTITYQAASAGGDVVTVGLTGLSGVVLRLRNGSGSAITVTLAGSTVCSQGSTHNTVITAAATADTEVYIPSVCVNASTGNVAVSYSGVTTLTVAAIDYVL